jgi:hypothetical protein
MAISIQITVKEYHTFFKYPRKPYSVTVYCATLIFFLRAIPTLKKNMYLWPYKTQKYWQNIKSEDVKRKNSKYLQRRKEKVHRGVCVSERILPPPHLPSALLMSVWAPKGERSFLDVTLDGGCVAMEVRSVISLAPMCPSQHFWQWWQVVSFVQKLLWKQPCLLHNTLKDCIVRPHCHQITWEGDFSFLFLKLDSSVCASTTEIEILAERSPLSGALSCSTFQTGHLKPSTQAGRQRAPGSSQCLYWFWKLALKCWSLEVGGLFQEGSLRHKACIVLAKQMLLPEHLIKGNRFPSRTFNKCT